MRRSPPALPMLRPLAAAVVAAFSVSAHAQTGPLPVLQPGGVYSGANAPVVNGTVMNIQQTAARATLEWNTFNIHAGHAVRFQQPTSSAVALNRVLGAERSVIQGLLQANGQVYILNNNGILFDRGSQVNVHTLLASTLGMNEVLYADLGVSETRSFFLTGDKELRTSEITPRLPHFSGATTGPDGKPARIELLGEVRTSGGPVMVFAPSIRNEGTIASPDGQVLLAAGDSVWLTRPLDTDTALRGYIVEFRAGAATDLASALERSSVVNTGSISADRGNVTLAALAVNQAGRARASSAAYLNGSVYLIAAEGAGSSAGGRRSGSVTLAAGSVTETPLDTTDRSTVADSESYAPYRSNIALSGNSVEVRGEVRAPGGVIEVNRIADDGAGGLAGTAARVRVESGAVLSAAGAWVDLPADHNVVEIQVTSNELKDSPLQKGGVLQGATLNVDLRLGTPLFDTSAYAGSFQRTVFEKAGAGGEISIRTPGDLIVRPGALLDVSGGGARYAAGYVGTSRLSSGGAVVDVANASPERAYQSVLDSYSVSYERWGVNRTWRLFEGRNSVRAADVEGRAGGTLSVSAPGGVVLEGEVRGETTAGRLQLDKGTLPAGATFRAGTQLDPLVQTYSLSTVDLSQRGPVLPAGEFSGPLPAGLAGRLSLPADFFRTGEAGSDVYRQLGFGAVEIFANDAIFLPQGRSIAMPAGGSIALNARAVAVDGTIVAPAGAIRLSGIDAGSASTAPSVRLGEGASLIARGAWVNQTSAAVASAGGRYFPRLVDGGSVVLAALDLETSAGSLIDVTAGGLLAANGALTGGSAGSVSLRAQTTFLASGAAFGTPRLGGQLRGYGFRAPGTLAIAAEDLCIGSASCGLDAEFRLDPARFGADGFGTYALSALGDAVVLSGAQIRPRVEALVVDPAGAGRFATGADVYDFASPYSPTPDLRRAASISIAAGATLDVQAGSAIVTEASGIARGAVTLTASNRLQVHGRVEAPGGAITLGLQTSSDPAANPDALLLGAGAVLSTAGAYVQKAGARPELRAGEVTGGGSVTLTAIGAPMTLAQGSLIDVSGASATLDLPSGAFGAIAPAFVTSDAGSVVITSSELTRIEGTLAGRAQGASAGGALAVEMRLNPALGEPTPVPERRILVAQDRTGLPAPGSSPALGSAAPRDALLAVGDLVAQGFDKLRLGTPGRIAFRGDVTLDLARALRLDAPVTSIDPGARVNLSAPRVELANAVNVPLPATLGAAGGGTLGVAAGNVLDVIGQVGYDNVAMLKLSSGGDLRLTSLFLDGNDSDAVPDTRWGLLRSGADIRLEAAQVYPTTYSQFRIESPTRIAVGSNGAAPAAAYSAGGELTLAAPVIEQGGVLKAPLGRIELDAGAGSVALLPGSVTSASAEGLAIPFGGTSGGVEWAYLGAVIQTPPDKRVTLRGDDVDVRAGSRIDVSGGGEFLGIEFLAGPGGSTDFLARSDVFAILPESALAAAPRDAAIPGSAALAFGADGAVYDSVYLAGAPGLPAGRYALLPGYYALLPGAWIVRPQTGKAYQDLQPGQFGALADGSRVIAGYRTVSGTGIAQSRWSGFAVSRPQFSQPGVLPQSEYVLSGSGFFTESALAADRAAPRVPLDAGRVSIAATGALRLGGILDTSAPGARGEVEFTAGNRDIVVAGNASQALQSSYDGYAPGSFLRLDAQALGALDARLLIGGNRGNGGGALTVAAPSVILDNPEALGGAVLAGPEVILAATERVILAEGSRIAGSGEFSGQASDLAVSGAGALLRVSSGPQVALSRPGLALPAAQGRLAVLAGASVAGKAISLDATSATVLGGTLDFGAARGALDIGAPRISLGEANGLSGLAFSNEQLARFATLEQLALRSYSTIDFYGNAALGGGELGTVTLSGAGLGGYAVTDAAGTRQAAVTIAADTLRLQNPTTATFDTPLAGGGTLEVQARDVVFGPGVSEVRGFARAAFAASETVRGEGAGTLRTAGALDVSAARITGASGSDLKLIAAGAVALSRPADAALPEAPLQAGGKLEIAGATVAQGSRIELPAGTVRLTSGGDLTLAEGSYTGAGAFAKDINGSKALASAGSVILTSAAGSVKALEGATVDLAAPQGAEPGELRVTAASSGGTFEAAGAMTGGSAVLDLGVAGDFAGYNAVLNAGGFARSRSIRVRQGDLTVPAGTAVRAREIKLVAESGALALADGSPESRAQVDASSSLGEGRVELYAGGKITLGEHSRVAASGVSAGTGEGDPYVDGGLVRIESRSAADGTRLEFRSMAEIDVSAGAKGDAGRIEFITSRTPAAHALLAGKAIGNAGAGGRAGEVVVYGNEITTIAGAAGTDVTLVTNSTNPAWTSYNAFVTGGALAAAQDAVRASLQLEGIDAGSIFVRPGVELQSAANLVMASPWDLTGTGTAGWYRDSVPGLLSIRSDGNISIQASLGFVAAQATQYEALPATDTWSIQLVGGANRASVDRAAVLPRTFDGAGGETTPGGDVRLVSTATSSTAAGFGPNVRVRTGTGDIEIHARRDFAIATTTAANATNYANALRSAVYTTGVPAAAGAPACTAAGDPLACGAFAVRAGDVRIFAQRHASGLDPTAVPGSSNNHYPYLGDWLRRTTTISSVPPAVSSWWAYRPNFHGVGSFGGGDVTVRAGGDVRHLPVAAATSGAAAEGSPASLEVNGGGDLLLAAGGDVMGGSMLVGAGAGRVEAGGSVGAGTRTAFYLMGLHDDPARAGATLAVEAGRDVRIQNLSNPTILPPTTAGAAPSVPGFQFRRTHFFTYDEDDAASFTAVNGDLSLAGNSLASRAGGVLNTALFNIAPPQLSLASLEGSVAGALTQSIGGELRLVAPSSQVHRLYPGDAQRLTVLAGRDIHHLQFDAADAPVAGLPAWNSPQVQITEQSASVSLSGTVEQAIYAPLGESRYVVSAGRDIYDLQGIFSGAAEVRAGRDLDTLRLDFQNNGAGEVSLLYAGRDLRQDLNLRSGPLEGGVFGTAQAASKAQVYVRVGGPGRLLVQAGRGIDLGSSSGIAAQGSLGNPSLPSGTSAALTVLAGYSGEADFAAIDALFADLVAAGKANDAAAGDAAVARAFDASKVNDLGNISMYNSSIVTEAGSGIDLLVVSGEPGSRIGGNLNAGLPGAGAADIGVITRFGGGIRAYTVNDFLVNASKVVTQLGGDIVAYSAQAGIDAGRGARTSVASAAVRFEQTDANADGVRDLFAERFLRPPLASIGSGIRSNSFDPDGSGPLAAPPPGSIFLFAPRGTINAGEAGIASAGDVFVVALQVLNAQNITAQGASTGVPVAVTSNVSGALTGASSTAAAATQLATEASRLTEDPTFRPSFITVRVLGFGE